MANLFLAYNGPKVTTAAPASVTTGATVKTLLQLQPTSKQISIVEWGISFDGTSGVPIKVELIDTQGIAATVTAFVSGDISQLDGPNDDASLVTLGTAASGYTATSEGTITSTRLLDLQLVSPAGAYVKQFPLGERPVVVPGKNLRVRVTAPVAVNAYTYIAYRE